MGRLGALSFFYFMDLQHGLLFGTISMIVYVIGFVIAYIVYERHRKNIERIEADKKKTFPYDFK
jgi:glycerol-3-phosphate acyltransferase PlsY